MVQNYSKWEISSFHGTEGLIQTGLSHSFPYLFVYQKKNPVTYRCITHQIKAKSIERSRSSIFFLLQIVVFCAVRLR